MYATGPDGGKVLKILTGVKSFISFVTTRLILSYKRHARYF